MNLHGVAAGRPPHHVEISKFDDFSYFLHAFCVVFSCALCFLRALLSCVFACLVRFLCFPCCFPCVARFEGRFSLIALCVRAHSALFCSFSCSFCYVLSCVRTAVSGIRLSQSASYWYILMMMIIYTYILMLLDSSFRWSIRCQNVTKF